MSKFILGTAQFGKDYGISNLENRTAAKKINQIIKLCKKNKINIIDISENYYSKKIDIILKKNFKNLIIKISNFNKKNYREKISNIFSYNKSIYCIMFHKASDLKKNYIFDVIKLLILLKKKRIIKYIGVSIYTKKDFLLSKKILKNNLDIIQAPINILDKRFINKNFLNFCKINNIKIHARSIFLQGLLLMNKRPKYFNKWKNIFQKWDLILDQDEKIKLCLNFLKKQKQIDKIILGVLDDKQLKKNY